VARAGQVVAPRAQLVESVRGILAEIDRTGS